MHPTHTTVTESTVTPATTLRAAARYLTRYGWVQGTYYDQTATVFTPAACMVGAIAMVCYGGPVEAPAQLFDAPEFGDFEAALTWLERCLNGATAYVYNDETGRNRQEITDTLRRTADSWERDNVRCPDCGEPAYSRPPKDWRMPTCWPGPAYSHPDETPLCPVYGPDGVTPALPVLTEGSV